MVRILSTFHRISFVREVVSTDNKRQGLTKQDFHKILNIASQPIKSSARKLRTSVSRPADVCIGKNTRSHKIVDTSDLRRDKPR